MDRGEFLELLRAADERRQFSLDRAERDYRDAVRSLRTVWHLANPDIEPPVPNSGSSETVPKTDEEDQGMYFPGLTAAVIEVIQERNGLFTMPQIADEVERRYPGRVNRTFIPSILNKLVRRNLLHRAERASPGEPTLYQRL